MKTSVTNLALADISKHIQEEIESGNKCIDYIVTPAAMNTKHTRYLNRILGINTINKQIDHSKNFKRK